MFYVIWQPYMLSIGVDVIELGLLQSIINVSTVAGLITWGFLSDSFGRKPMILASSISRILALVALILSSEFAFLVCFAFFVGFSALFMQGNPARSALVSESVGQQKRATAISTLMAISQMTIMLTASAGGYLAARMGFHVIFYACILGDLVGIVLMTFFLRETYGGGANKTEKNLNMRSRAIGLLRPEGDVKALYMLMILFGIGYGTGYSLFNAMLYDNFGFDTIQLGFLSSTFNLTWGVSSIPLGRLSDRFGRKPMLILSTTMAIITVLGFLFAKTFQAFLIFSVTNALDPAFFISAWISMISERIPSKGLSTILGKIDAYYWLAGIPAPWAGGVLYSTFGFSAPLTVHLVFMIFALILILNLKEARKKI